MTPYIKIDWNGEPPEITEADKEKMFSDVLRHTNEFQVGDPIIIFRENVKKAIEKEAIYSCKYTVSRKSLEELKINIKKIIEEEFDCHLRIKIPLLDTNSPLEWQKARERRYVGGIWITAEKMFDEELMRVIVM